MTDYGDAKLPDPPAYDPRIERADAEELIMSKRSEKVFDMAVNDGNPFLCAMLINYLARVEDVKPELQRGCDAISVQLQIKVIRELVPDDVRDALDLDD